MNNFDEFWEHEPDGRFVTFIKKFGTSFILLVSALLSISFYVTAGVAVFGWMPQEWMMVLCAIVLGLTGNELAVSFWLSVRSRARNLTESQATIVQAGIAAGAVTSTLTTLASFIVTPETSPAFLAEYADVIAFTMMSIPVIIQTLLVMGFLAFTREAEVASEKAKVWGKELTSTVKISQAMSRETLHEKEQEVRRRLPEYSKTVGQHGAKKLVDKGLDVVKAEGGIVTIPLNASSAPAPAELLEHEPIGITYAIATAEGGDDKVLYINLRDRVDAQRRAERYTRQNNVATRVLEVKDGIATGCIMTYSPEQDQGNAGGGAENFPNGR